MRTGHLQLPLHLPGLAWDRHGALCYVACHDERSCELLAVAQG